MILDPISVFADWAVDSERPLRKRIHRARDKLTARANRSKHYRARELYRWAAGFASDWVFARADIDELEGILAALTRIFITAQFVERLEQADE